jgi:hypothetical protein
MTKYKMKKLAYSPRWDLSTIPPELIRAECAHLNGLLGGRKIQPTRRWPKNEQQGAREHAHIAIGRKHLANISITDARTRYIQSFNRPTSTGFAFSDLSTGGYCLESLVSLDDHCLQHRPHTCCRPQL